MLDGEYKEAIRQCAALMADTVTGSHDDQHHRPIGVPLIGDREDLAYLQGFRLLEALQLGMFGRRWLIRHFKRALAKQGLSDLDAELQAAQFRAYYWIKMVGLTQGDARRVSRKNRKQSVSDVYRLRNKTGQPALFL